LALVGMYLKLQPIDRRLFITRQ